MLILRQIRKERELTLEQLASLSGVGKTNIWQIEIGDVSPTLTTLEKLAEGLEIHVRDLFDDNEDPGKVDTHGKEEN